MWNDTYQIKFFLIDRSTRIHLSFWHISEVAHWNTRCKYVLIGRLQEGERKMSAFCESGPKIRIRDERWTADISRWNSNISSARFLVDTPDVHRHHYLSPITTTTTAVIVGSTHSAARRMYIHTCAVCTREKSSKRKQTKERIRQRGTASPFIN